LLRKKSDFFLGEHNERERPIGRDIPEKSLTDYINRIEAETGIKIKKGGLQRINLNPEVSRRGNYNVAGAQL